jgi:large subunit ribosomal protein L21
MYAVVKVGGKQYRVEEGDSLVVDRLREDEGAKVALEPLMLGGGKDVVFEHPELDKVKVEAVVAGHERGKKIHVLKFKPKKGYRRRQGHRAELTRLEVKEIKLLSRKPAAKKAEKPAAAEAKPAAKKPAAAKRTAGEAKAAAGEAKPAAAKKPATKKPAAKKPAAKKPAAKKPAARKPAAKAGKEGEDGS